MRRECCSAEKYCTINFEETELRLGVGVPLPRETTTTASSTTKNGDSDSDSKVNSAKRVFSDTVDLKLNLQITNPPPPPPPAKAQVVGWPPVRSFRKNIMSVQKTACTGKDGEGSGATVAPAAAFVKVSLDGAPYLRKVDLKLYKSYTQLSDALTKMFTIGKCGSQGMKELMNESKLIDLLNDSDYVPTYEDKDGDWMLVGDVPWEDALGRRQLDEGDGAWRSAAGLGVKEADDLGVARSTTLFSLFSGGAPSKIDGGEMFGSVFSSVCTTFCTLHLRSDLVEEEKCLDLIHGRTGGWR